MLYLALELKDDRQIGVDVVGKGFVLSEVIVKKGVLR
jgi:hypothetical protein